MITLLLICTERALSRCVWQVPYLPYGSVLVHGGWTAAGSLDPHEGGSNWIAFVSVNTTTHGQEIDIRGQVLLVLEDSSACFGDTSSSVQSLLQSLSTCTCCITITVGWKLRVQADVASAQVECYMGELKIHADKTFRWQTKKIQTDNMMLYYYMFPFLQYLLLLI